MSGIYIPGAMPKDGEIIVLHPHGYVARYAFEDIDFLDYPKMNQMNQKAIPVPDHGRLIDADALEDFILALKQDAIHAYEWTGKSGEWNARITERGRFAVTIEDAPTIIPADKEAGE